MQRIFISACVCTTCKISQRHHQTSLNSAKYHEWVKSDFSKLSTFEYVGFSVLKYILSSRSHRRWNLDLVLRLIYRPTFLPHFNIGFLRQNTKDKIQKTYRNVWFIGQHFNIGFTVLPLDLFLKTKYKIQNTKYKIQNTK